MRSIVALDLSGSVGWCSGPPDAFPPRCGTFVLPKTGDDVGTYLLAYEEWLEALLAVEDPAVVNYEAPFIPGGESANLKASMKLISLCGVTELICTRRRQRLSQGLVILSSHVSTLKAWFAGSGRAEKLDMIQAARGYGFEFTGEHEADAAAVWAYTVYCKAPHLAQRFSMGRLSAGAVRSRKS